MKRFHCPVCGSRMFFDDQTCLNCGAEAAYDPGADNLALALRTCTNRFRWLCNWVAADDDAHCAACLLDRSVDGPPHEVTIFQGAKRRVLRQLFGLGVVPAGAQPPLRFDLLHGGSERPVTIGHSDGVITLDISEGDLAHLERVRVRLGEPYRTPLGHIRHEVGHWHWQAFVAPDQLRLSQCRAQFGDERADYSAALQWHYDRRDDGSWQDRFLSHYASAHPWEDYAESFAHVLHMMDTVETAVAEGFLTGQFRGIADIYRQWAPLTVSLNEIARSMGTAEPYPFAPPEAALVKMLFVYDVINGSQRAQSMRA